MLEIIVWFNDGSLKKFPKVDEDKILVDSSSMVFIYGDDRISAFINLNNVNYIERYHIEKEEDL